MSISRLNEEKEHPITAEFKDLNDTNDFSKALILVSVGNPDYEGLNLNAIVSSLNSHHQKNPKFNKIDTIIAGTLQRHNFWTFSSELSDKELKELLEDISTDVDLYKLAEIFAKKFRSAAEQREVKYIENNIAQYRSLNDIQVRIITWDQELNTASDNVQHVTYQTDYARFYAEIKSNYESRDDFKKAFDTTISVHLRTKEDLIKKEALRIAQLVPGLKKFFLDPMALARICCRNYLFEECPLLIPLLYSRGYKEIIYPGSMSTALKATKELYNSQISYIKITFEKKKKEKINLKKPDPIPYDVELPIFRSKHKDIVEIDKEKLKAVTARFAALKATYSVEESNIYEYDCVKYVKSNKYSSLLHAKAFSNAALRYYWEREFTKAIQYFQDAMFVNESYSHDYQSRITYLQSFSPDLHLPPRTSEELNTRLSYHNVSMFLNVYSRWDVLEKELESSEKLLLNSLCSKWNSFSLFRCLLQTRMMIAKGDSLVLQNENVKALDYYKDAKFNDADKSDYTQLAEERIRKVSELLSPNLQHERMLSFFRNQPCIYSVMSNYNKLYIDLEEFSVRYHRYSVVNHVFDNRMMHYLNELADKYKVDFNFEYSPFNILTLAHAIALESRGNEEMWWNYYRFEPLDTYAIALHILDFFSEVWGKVSSEKTAASKARLLAKMDKAVQYKIAKGYDFENAYQFNQLIQNAFINIANEQVAISNIGESLKQEILINNNLRIRNLFEELNEIEDPEEDPGILYLDSLEERKLIILDKVNKILNEKVLYTDSKIFDFYIPLFNYVNYSPTLSLPDDSSSFVKTTKIKTELLTLLRSDALKYLQFLIHRLKQKCVNNTATYHDMVGIIEQAKALPLFSQHYSSWPSFFARADSSGIKILNNLLETVTYEYDNGSSDHWYIHTARTAPLRFT